MRKLAVALLLVVACGAFAYAADDEKPADAKSTESKSTDTKSKAKSADADSAAEEEQDPEKVDWSKVDWRKRLSRLQYYITREAGTERPFRNKYWDNFKEGSYKCVGCGLPLFESTSKFDAHCGWPTFDRTIAKNSVTEHKDFKLLEQRVEIRCRRCGAHLGHVFNDGPTDTGQRYCMNSAALRFIPAKDAKGKSAVAADKPAAKAKEKTADDVEEEPTADEAGK